MLCVCLKNLQKLVVLFGKRPTCKKFHILPKENFASASPSKTYVPYINMTLHSFENSSTYGWFSYWAFNLSTLWEFSSIWSNSSSSAIHTCRVSMLVVIIFFFYFILPSKTKIFYNLPKGYKNDGRLFPLTHPMRRYLSILRNMHQFFTQKSFIMSILQIVQDTITWFLYN